jgi:hypothetical protein
MKEIKIFVTGIQYACPVNFIEFLEAEFKVQREIREIKCKEVEAPYIGTERICIVEIPNYQGQKLKVASIMPAVWYDRELHEIMLPHCDAVILVLTILKEREQANFERISSLVVQHQQFCPQAPVITLLNNFWGTELDFDLFRGRTLNLQEKKQNISPQSLMFETSLGKIMDPKLDPKSVVIRTEGGRDVLNCLLDLIEMKNRK